MTTRKARIPMFLPVACALALTVGGPSWADEAPPPPQAPAVDPQAEAEALRQKADSLAQEGKLDEGQEAYRAAFAKHRDPRTAARLGELELAQGKAVEAAALLSFAVRAFPPDGPPEAFAQLQQRLAEAKRLVREVLVRANTSFAEVWIDGARAGLTSDGPLYVAPGPHRVRVKSPGMIVGGRPINAAAGSSQEVSFSMTRLGPSPCPEEKPKAHDLAPPSGRLEPIGGKSKALITTGFVTGGLLTVFGMNLLIAPKNRGERGFGTAMLLSGGVIGVGIGIYGIWPEPKAAPGRDAQLPAGQPWRRSEATWDSDSTASVRRANGGRIPQRSRSLPSP